MRTHSLALALILTACPGAGDDGGDTQTPGTPATTSITSAETAAPDPTTGPAGTSSSGTTGSAATTVDDSTTTAAMTATTTTGDVTTTLASSTGDDATSTGGVKLDMPVDNSIPVHDIPGLESITFYETTGQVTEYTFAVNGPELSNLLADPLSMANRDIQGTSVEFYDVYYSDIDGVFDPDGRYLTIAGSFGAKLPAGGGLNLAEISLNSAIAA
jgi:hypothetical protein